MKKFYSLLALGLLSSATCMAQLGQSATPDDYGYTWKSDSVAGGPTYSWIDITNSGTEINGLADDNTVGPFNLGFTFRYYWTDITQFRVGSNGYLLLGTNGQISSTATGFPAMPSASNPNNVVAPFMADLNFSEEPGATNNPGQVFYYTNNADTAIVSFINVPFWSNPANEDPNGWSGSNTFQVLFLKADSSVTFQYQSQAGSWNSGYDQPAVTHPFSIGIENITGGIGLQVGHTVKPTGGTAVKFYHPDNVTFSVTDAAVTSVQNDNNRGFFGVSNVPMPINATLGNVGNQDITSAIALRTTVRKASSSGSPTGALLFDQTQSVNSLNEGQEANIAYGTTFTPPVPPVGNANPSYIVQSTLTLTGDQNPSNNTNLNEMVLLDTTGVNTVTLRYHDNVPEGVLGFEGGAVYFKPPFYPVTITNLNFFLTAAAGAVPTNGYTAKIFLEDANGQPAASPAFEQVMLANDILLSAPNAQGYNNLVPVNQNVTVTSGGFFVSWEASDVVGAQNVYVGSDATGPFSRQTYEVLFGTFGEYRSGESEDLFIGADITIPAPNSVSEGLVSNFSIHNVYPNPAAAATNVAFSLVEPANVSITLTSITGQQVKQVNYGTRNAGNDLIQVPVSELASGIYFMTMQAGNSTVTRKLVITK